MVQHANLQRLIASQMMSVRMDGKRVLHLGLVMQLCPPVSENLKFHWWVK